MICDIQTLRKALKPKSGKRPQFAGVILYEGPSLIDGKPIVVIANRIVAKSRNGKTGHMVQTFVIRRDIDPRVALKTGDDESVCGNCPQRPFLKGKCYVDVSKSVRSVYAAYGRDRYARPGIDFDRSLLPALFAGLAFRMGTYGNPSAAPFQIWRAATLNVARITGYEHMWRLPQFQAFKLLCMASCETEEDVSLAQSMGWRTFRAKQEEGSKLQSEIGCPAAKENGARTSCDKCGLCAGVSSNSKRNIVINLHGIRVSKKRKALIAA